MYSCISWYHLASVSINHQSAYRAFCSTETLIARVLSDILTALDSGDIAALSLLDLSTSTTTFDTVDHSILFRRLQRSLWAERLSTRVVRIIYLNQRQQHVSHRGVESATTTTQFGVPHAGQRTRSDTVHTLHGRHSAPGTAACTVSR